MTRRFKLERILILETGRSYLFYEYVDAKLHVNLYLPLLPFKRLSAIGRGADDSYPIQTYTLTRVKPTLMSEYINACQPNLLHDPPRDKS